MDHFSHLDTILDKLIGVSIRKICDNTAPIPDWEASHIKPFQDHSEDLSITVFLTNKGFNLLDKFGKNV